MTPDQLLNSVDCVDLEKALAWVDEVKALPLLSSGGVQKSEKIENHFVIVLGEDPHGSMQALLETFVHEILHIILFVSFPLADHEAHHERIREVSAQLAKVHGKRVQFLLLRYLPSELVRKMSCSFS